MGDIDSTQSDVEQYLAEVLKNAKEQRLDTEAKWNRNRAARHADASLDPKGTWKSGEGQSDNPDPESHGKADTFFAVIKQKCVAAHSIVDDEVLKGSQVPFMLALRDQGHKTDLLEQDPSLIQAVNNEIDHAENRIERQFENCEGAAEMSRCLDDDIAYGETWAHVYVTDMESKSAVEVAPGLFEDMVDLESAMAVEHVTPWEMYRDMESKEPMTGQYVIRRRMESAYDIRQLLNTSPEAGFIPSKINEVLRNLTKTTSQSTSTEIGLNEDGLPPYMRNVTNRKKNIERCEFWVLVPTRKALDFENRLPILLTTDTPDGTSENVPAPSPPIEEEEAGDMVRCLCTTANGYIIQFVRDPGPLRYFRVEWEPDNDSPNGRGIPDNLECTQKTLNGMIRSLENNTKLMANLMIAIRESAFKGDVAKVFKEGGILKLKEDDLGPDGDVGKAIQQLTFTDITGSLVRGIEMFMQFADLESSIPRAEQGQQSSNPQTAFELQQRLERSGKYLGNCIRRFDVLIRWVVDQFHTYNMRNPALTDGKGDFVVKALGFSSFNNRVIKLQKLMQMLSMIAGNEMLSERAKMDWLLIEIAKAMDLDPDQMWKSAEEFAAEQQAKAESEEAKMQTALANLQVAKLTADTQKTQADAGKSQAQAQATVAKIDQDEQRIATERAKAIADIERGLKPSTPVQSQQKPKAA